MIYTKIIHQIKTHILKERTILQQKAEKTDKSTTRSTTGKTAKKTLIKTLDVNRLIPDTNRHRYRRNERLMRGSKIRKVRVGNERS